MRDSVSCPPDSLISLTTTSAPSRANRRAVARPVPLPPDPVMIATLSFRFMRCVQSYRSFKGRNAETEIGIEWREVPAHLGRKTKKASVRRPRPFEFIPAATYVPTQLPAQYHRPGEA